MLRVVQRGEEERETRAALDARELHRAYARGNVRRGLGDWGRRGGGRAPWNPLLLGSKLTLWLDQRDQTLVSGKVSAWGDQSPAGTADLSQATAGLRPDGTTSVNGWAAPTFDGIDDWELLAVAWTAVMGTVGGRLLVVIDNTGVTPGADNASIHSEPAILCSTASTGYVLAWSTSGPRANAYDGAHHVTSRIAMGVGLHLLDMWVDGAGINLKCDDTAATPAATGAVVHTGSAVVGRNWSNAAFFGGKIGSFVGMTPDASASEVSAARAYLRAKYAGTWT